MTETPQAGVTGASATTAPAAPRWPRIEDWWPPIAPERFSVESGLAWRVTGAGGVR